MSDLGSRVVAALRARGLTIAVAESLTGGSLVARLIDTPGASAAVRGGVVAYDTALKHSLLGVDSELLAEHGAVHADVAAQMAVGVRIATSIDGMPADVGVSTTGVAGPEPQDGQPVGTVFVGVAIDDTVTVTSLALSGDRATIRREVVELSLAALLEKLSESRE